MAREPIEFLKAQIANLMVENSILASEVEKYKERETAAIAKMPKVEKEVK